MLDNKSLQKFSEVFSNIYPFSKKSLSLEELFRMSLLLLGKLPL